MQFVIGIVLSVLFVLPAIAQQQIPHPTAEQVNIQILENEATRYRATISQLAVQVNDLTAKLDALKAKCGDLCKDEKK